ncbi:MAG: uroporphyrinogen-III synthase [Myxococcota bacterium]
MVLYTGTRPAPARAGLILHHAPMLRVTSLALAQTQAQELLGGQGRVEIVLSSGHALTALTEAGVLRVLAPTLHRIWCVGERTAQRARSLLDGFEIETPRPAHQNFEGMMDALRMRHDLAQHVVVLGLEGKSRHPGQSLEGLDVKVTELPVYATRPVLFLDWSELPVRVDWVVCTSPRGARAFFDLFAHAPGAARKKLRDARYASIGPTTSAALEALGTQVALEASLPDIRVLLDELSVA